ncbi:MAG: PfkB family carbohydrate kinase [Anaerolineae bacterium]
MNNDNLIISFGELLIDFVPTVNGVSLAEAPAFKKAPGGAPANVAAGLAKLGHNATFLGKVGDDEFGRMLAKVLQEAGVDTSLMSFDTAARTALAFVTLKANGEREFMFYRHPSADMLLAIDEVDMDAVRNASIFHYGSISLIAEPCRSTHLKILDEAKQAGVFLSYDPNLRLPLWDSPQMAKEGIMSIWETADIIKISDEELEFLTGEDTDASAKSLMFDGLKLLIVTEGPNGARYYTPDFHGKVDGFKVEAVDTTGAGDAFVAGLLSKLLANKAILQNEAQLQRAIRFANAAGAITTTGRGAIPSLPTIQQIEDMF